MTNEMNPTDLVKSLFEAFSRGDAGYIVERVAPDCRWTVPGAGVPSAGVYTGPEGVAEFFEKLGETEKITAFEVREFVSTGDTVVALGVEAMTSLGTSKAASTDWAMVFRVSGGKVAEYQGFFDTEAYAEAHRGQNAASAADASR